MSTRAPLIACIAVLSFFAGITGVRLAYTLAYVLVFLLALAFVWSRAIARRLEVSRESPEGSFMVGEPFTERFTVVNRGILPVAYCELHDGTRIPGYVPGRAFSLAGGGSVTWATRGVFLRRGLYSFGPIEARLGDPFGLFPRGVRVAPRTTVLVYPAVHAVGELGVLTSGSSVGDAPRGRPLDVPPDVATVREYDPSDGMGRIHWATTARTGRLMSRVHDTRQSADVLVFLDLRRGLSAGDAPESVLEYAVTLAASVCHAGLRRGQAVGLVTNDSRHTAIGAGRGEAQRLRILEYLATAEDDGSTTLAETITRYGEGWRGRGGIILITADRNPGWIEAVLDVGVRGQRHLTIFVEPTSFGATGPPMRVLAAWRLALDWWLVRRGDDLSVGRRRRAVGQ
ncbi:MAG TPA: DUF58 domain-containing protein [Candidatus Dormibacteraeota bacterium]|nr:DUF58 domain-containing protein [Candidatus Dormibacteraeota bacterium]